MNNPFASMPAPLNHAAPRTQATQRKTGLLPMVAGSKHQIMITAPGQPTRSLYTTAQHPETVLHALHDQEHKAVCVCLNPACAGKAWKTELEMRQLHAPPSELAKIGAAHVWGFWSPKPADGDRAAQLKADMEAARQKAAGAKGAERDAAQGDIERAKAELAALPVVGLIAPPEARFEDA